MVNCDEVMQIQRLGGCENFVGKRIMASCSDAYRLTATMSRLYMLVNIRESVACSRHIN